LAELLEARGRANAVHELITATAFTHVEDPDALGADFFSQVVLTASLQIASHQAAVASAGGGGEFPTETAPLVLLKNPFQAIGGSHIQPTWRRRETHFQAIGGSHI